MTKTVVLNNFEDLVEAFPNMTLAQIIDMYKQVQEAIRNISKLLKMHIHSSRRKELEHELNDCLKADAFLGTYLAECFCRQNGF